jgi:hypothetical protein
VTRRGTRLRVGDPLIPDRGARHVGEVPTHSPRCRGARNPSREPPAAPRVSSRPRSLRCLTIGAGRGFFQPIQFWESPHTGAVMHTIGSLIPHSSSPRRFPASASGSGRSRHRSGAVGADTPHYSCMSRHDATGRRPKRRRMVTRATPLVRIEPLRGSDDSHLRSRMVSSAVAFGLAAGSSEDFIVLVPQGSSPRALFESTTLDRRETLTCQALALS